MEQDSKKKENLTALREQSIIFFSESTPYDADDLMLNEESIIQKIRQKIKIFQPDKTEPDEKCFLFVDEMGKNIVRYNFREGKCNLARLAKNETLAEGNFTDREEVFCLKFQKNNGQTRLTPFDYQTPYGKINLCYEQLELDLSEKNIVLVYDLYQHNVTTSEWAELNRSKANKNFISELKKNKRIIPIQRIVFQFNSIDGNF